MNRFVFATLGFIIGFIVIAVMLPAYAELVALMPFGTSVTFLISAMIVLIVVALLMTYVQDVMGNESQGY